MPHPVRDAALYLVLRAFLGIGGRLPLRLSRALGPVVGAIALRAVPRDRARVRDHLAIAFPDKDHGERDALMKGCARHFGIMLAEVAWLWRARPGDVESVCTLAGYEHFENALAEGRGVMFATAHCGNWELMSARLPVAGTPLITAVRELDDRRIDTLVNILRGRFGTEVIQRGPAAGRQLARALARNRVVGLLIDQDIRNVPGVFVPFFGRPAWTPSGAATLAIRMRCPMIPGFIHRRADGSHHVQIHPPLDIPTEGSLEEQIQELTAAATTAIERQVRAHPEQWVWMHRRWRTQPREVA
jgi:KDO2-lipid IV(A) lauroyltransferase